MVLFNQKLEQLLGIGLDDYPSSAYSLIEPRFENHSRFPSYFSYKTPEKPIFGLFGQIEVMTRDYVYNRHMKLICSDFSSSQMNQLSQLVNALAEIYGADEKRNLGFRVEEEEEVLLKTWNGRSWDFPFDEEIWAVVVFISDKELCLSIHEMGNLIDFD